MAAQPQTRVRKRLVWFSPLLLVVALSPAFLQTQYTCNRTGDTRLSSLELEVQGVDRLAFDQSIRAYDLWLPAGATNATVRAVPMDPAARVTWYVPDGAGMLASGSIGVGGGEVTIDLPPDGYSLYIGVFPPGGATNTYIVAINSVCPEGDVCHNGGRPGTCISDRCEFAPFPCTEQGILDAIVFGGGPHYFTCDGPTTVTTQAKIFIDDDVILDGRGDLTLSATGGERHGVLGIGASATVDLLGLTLTGGDCGSAPLDGMGGGSIALTNSGVLRIVSSSVSGNNKPINQITGYVPCGIGGISNTGTLTLIDSDVSQNHARGVGGISNTGTLSLIRSQVRWNTSFNGISAIGNTGTMTLVDSDVSNNSIYGSRYQPGSGSAIGNSGSMLLRSSAVSGNYNGGPSGRTILSSGPATLINTTVADNSYFLGGSVATAVIQSAGVLAFTSSTISGTELLLINTSGSGEIRATNSVFSSPSANTSACAGSIIDGGGNLESPGDSCGFAVSGVPTESLNLGPLADNGGPTETMALLPGSVAIDIIDSAACVDADGAPLTEDQRGVSRPQGSQCDAGAFEWADCSGTPCDDGNDCTADHCDPLDTSWCAYTPVADGTACDFGGNAGECIVGACEYAPTWSPIESWTTPDYVATASSLRMSSSGIAMASRLVVEGPSPSNPNYCQYADHFFPNQGWGEPERLSCAYLTPRASALGMDDEGNAMHLSVAQDIAGFWNLGAKRFTPATGWQAGSSIMLLGATSGFRSLFVRDGTVVAVATVFSPSSRGVRVQRFTPAGGWTGATLTDVLSASVSGVWDGPDGNLIVFWSLGSGGDDLRSSSFTTATGWQAAEPVGVVANMSTVRLDAAGGAVAVWLEDDGGLSTIWSKRLSPSLGWGVAERVDQDDANSAGSPLFALDPNGIGRAVWVQGDNVWANQVAPGGWGSPQPIGTAEGQVAANPQMATDANGNVLAVWTQDGQVWANRMTPDTWGAAERVSTAGTHLSTNVRFAADTDGSAIVVWSRNDDGGVHSLWWNRFTPDLGWRRPQPLDDVGATEPYDVRLRMSADGNAAILWVRDEITWTSRFE